VFIIIFIFESIYLDADLPNGELKVLISDEGAMRA